MLRSNLAGTLHTFVLFYLRNEYLIFFDDKQLFGKCPYVTLFYCNIKDYI
jgi:hypothetical protein